ncbi:mercury resistance system transport protein MerF [Marinimicrococcus flavescens]|uniref:Mercury resistance system transport protein MerF n=1 Tax=Marinimicrococcus flavescens TaxID=3031815 RepID=A0AAP4D6U2_9PROT|nr:mercury resistance system transport protein MerF [Marinimicrococcus flavescens]
MNDRNLLGVGVVGTIVAAICCFTPILVLLLAALGFSALVGWLDIVLFPALGLFAGITVYALWKRGRRP